MTYDNITKEQFEHLIKFSKQVLEEIEKERDKKFGTEPTPHKPTKISELGENDVIHTKTEAEYYRISDLLTSANKKWRMGEKYGDISHWKYHKAKFCFWPSDGTRQDKKYYKKEGRNIIPSTQITQL